MKEGYRIEEVDAELVKSIIAMLILNTRGPGQAFAAIACVLSELLKLNKESTGEDVSIKDITEELASSMFSIHTGNETQQ